MRAVLGGRWWVVALTTVFAAAAAAGGLSLVAPTYRSTATLQAPIATGVQAPNDLTYVDRLMNTYTALATQQSYRADVERLAGVRGGLSLSVSVQPNTELLQLSATASSPDRALRIASIAATVLVDRTTAFTRATSQVAEGTLASELGSISQSIAALRDQLARLSADVSSTNTRLSLTQSILGQQLNYQALVQQRAQLQFADAVRQQTLSVVQPPSRPSSPASPHRRSLIALALVLGLLGGLALAFTLERLRPRLYSVAEIESAADASVLAAIPRVSRRELATPIYNGGSAAQEAYGVLAVQVLAAATSRRVHTILVTSRNPGDGKSAVASNLAAELARSKHKVVLVDADMRKPTVHEIFKLAPEAGLSSLLEGPELPARLEEFTIAADGIPNLWLLPAGPPHSDAARLLASDQLLVLVAQLTANHDFVVFDSPPLGVGDPLSIARLCDLVLLITGDKSVADSDIQASKRQLAQIGVKHVSVVANRWRCRDRGYVKAESYTPTPAE
jgi:capsular exopolysaccharide synthesis family protein